MKKYLLITLIYFTTNTVKSQSISDAMRYAQENLNGTARFSAMGGAFGALGGDLSSLNINPAGSAVFNNNQTAVTIGNYNTKNNSEYFGTKTSADENTFDLIQIGGVFVFKNPSGDWKKVSLGVNYDKTNNYDNSIFSAGTNPTNSVDGYFLSYADGVPLNILENSNYDELDNGGQQAFLGYQGYVINPVTNDPSNTLYSSNVRSGGNYYQENSVYTNGYNGKIAFNIATEYKDVVYIGLNLNLHTTDYVQSSRFYEENSNTLDIYDRVNRLTFDNNLYTYGTGFSFQLGAIAKVTSQVRLGLAYESPTWYNLNDEFSQKLVAVSSNITGELPPDVVDPNIINVYAPYDLQTPGKITGSFAYVFGKSGLISVDYALKDYSNTEFAPKNDSYFSTINNSINSTLTSASELRIGGEYKIDQWSLRAGYRYEQSPYKNSNTIGDLNGYSGGLGYNFGSTKVDLAYMYSERSSQQGFFNRGFTDGATINTIKNTFSLTLLFEL